MLTRRQFLQTAAATTAAAQMSPKRVAIVAGNYRVSSPGQQLGDRFLVGYPIDGAWHMPDMKVVSVYVDQHADGDLSAERSAQFGFQVVPTVAGAVQSADAVLIAGEPGSDLFEKCIKVFEQSGRAVPVFYYHNLSTTFDKAKALVEASRRLRFPLLAGSTLPATFRLPALELPLGCHIEDALMVGLADFDALEALQCMVERRGHGETGVRAVQLIEGDQVWGRCSRELLTAALSRSDTPLGLTVKDGRTQDLVASGELPKLVPKPVAYCIEYRDGLQAMALLLNGAVQEYTFAARVRGTAEIQSAQFFLPPTPNRTDVACLIQKVEHMFATGTAPDPVERTLLVCGILESCLRSKAQNGARLETPHLAVAYRAKG
jgi:hypothetical protein